MARELSLSPITIRRAYHDLENEGYLITRAGLGSFVAGISRDELRERKAQEIRDEIRRIVKHAETYGIPIGEIGRIVDEMKKARR
jgi:GntR family transcriptional regulator